jgi:hypothetical protein
MVGLLLVLVLPVAAAAQSIDRAKIWNENNQAVVKLMVSGRDAGGSPVPVRTGSGIIVDADGVIVTALDLVGRDDDWFEEGGRRDRRVEVIWLDEYRIERPLGVASVTPVPPLDIAALQITAWGLPAADIAEARPDELGEVVAILWDPDLNLPRPMSGSLVPTDISRYGDLLMIRMMVVPGHSGSGVFGADGKLVGIITNALGTTQALAVPAYRFPLFAPAIRPPVEAARPAPPYASSLPRLRPVRDVIEPDEIPPQGVGAYGMVALTHKPTSGTRDRLIFVCEAFLSTLPSRDSLPRSIPIGEQMITYWPIEKREPRKIAEGDCNYLIDKYHLLSGLEAIEDADRQRHLTEKRGPFLIGWSPAESRYKKDKIVLVMDLSYLDSKESFREAFQIWRTRITENPALWRNGFAIDDIRLALRDFLDRYGEGILRAISG